MIHRLRTGLPERNICGPDTALELVESRVTPSGVTIQVYRLTGRPRYGKVTVHMKHVT